MQNEIHTLMPAKKKPSHQVIINTEIEVKVTRKDLITGLIKETEGKMIKPETWKKEKHN